MTPSTSLPDVLAILLAVGVCLLLLVAWVMDSDRKEEEIIRLRAEVQMLDPLGEQRAEWLREGVQRARLARWRQMSIPGG